MLSKSHVTKPARSLPRRLALSLAVGAAVFTAVSACTPAQTVFGSASVPSHPTKTTPIAPQYAAPTANLTKLANALVMKHKSVTTQVTAPAHLGLTDPVSIKVQASGQDLQTYNEAAGNVFLANVPEDNGEIYDDNIAITLTETLPNNQTKSFFIDWRAYIEPLYNVDIGALTFYPVDSCTAGARSQNLKLYWRDPENRVDTDGNGMQYVPVSGVEYLGNVFALGQLTRHYTAVGQSTGALIKPQIAWVDGNSGEAVSWPSVSQSLVVGPNPGYWTELLQESNGENCHIIYRYPITKTLLTYPSL
jgi:hypothetical protein